MDCSKMTVATRLAHECRYTPICAIFPEPFSHLQASCRKKLLTSKIRYVFIRSMHARNASVTNVTRRVSGDLFARSLNVDNRGLSLLILISLIVLLIIERGAGTG